MVLFIAAVLTIGLAIFFYWRRTYGVWAVRRKEREAQARNDEKTQTIRYD
jgi:hypothetical protein